MISEGQIILFRFPATDRTAAKLRPALLLRQLPGPYDDWLICMISSRLAQQILGFDELITPSDSDFISSGLKLPSVIRIARLAVADASLLSGRVGQIGSERLRNIRTRLSQWITT